ncbi:MAG: GspE/PulE family protein [Syntrophobacteraceae bacterium]
MTDSTTSRQNHNNHKLELAEIVKDLLADGFITERDARKVISQGRSKDQSEIHPVALIANLGLNKAAPPHDPLTIEALTVWLSRKAGLSYQRIDPLKIDMAAVTGLVSYAYAARFKILPIEVNDAQVVVAVCEPYVTEWEEELTRILKRKIVRVLANPVDINRYLVEFYTLTESVKRAVGKSSGGRLSGGINLEQLVELSRAGKLDANDRYVVNIVDWLLQYAYDQRASDIHMEPRRETGDVRFRIDGVLHPVYQLPTVVMGAVISRLKVLGRMDLTEKRRPQDGRVRTKTPGGGEVELRLSTMPTVFGEKLVMRIFDPEVTIRSFEELGLNSHELTRWKKMVSRPYGIILVTGPTGSGKTTTLYSTLKQLAKPEVNVCTVEEPIEMVEPRFNQMQVQPSIGLDFASGLRNLLRQDPDIIMVGEIRDLETAEMAIQAALTGHLVFSTLHTNDAVSAIVRLLDIGVPHYLIRATLLGVVAQRLVRTLCNHCKQYGATDADIWKSLVNPWKIDMPTPAFLPGGCLECRETGYLGRIGLYEILMISSSLRIRIQENMDIAAFREHAIQEGMHPLHISGAQKICSGLTTLEEVFRVAGSSDEL